MIDWDRLINAPDFKFYGESLAEIKKLSTSNPQAV